MVEASLTEQSKNEKSRPPDDSKDRCHHQCSGVGACLLRFFVQPIQTTVHRFSAITWLGVGIGQALTTSCTLRILGSCRSWTALAVIWTALHGSLSRWPSSYALGVIAPLWLLIALTSTPWASSACRCVLSHVRHTSSLSVCRPCRLVWSTYGLHSWIYWLLPWPWLLGPVSLTCSDVCVEG